MSRTAARCTQADIARAIRAVEQVGAHDWAVEVLPDGTIRIGRHRQSPNSAGNSNARADPGRDDGGKPRPEIVL